MRFDYQRRLAASLLGIGVNRVWITTDPKVQDDILDAITRDGIRNLIRKNIIQKRPVQGVSRGRARERAAQRAKGRRRGPGSRKGGLNARTPQKTPWIQIIRGMRRHLRELPDQGRIDTAIYRRGFPPGPGGRCQTQYHLGPKGRAAGANAGGMAGASTRPQQASASAADACGTARRSCPRKGGAGAPTSGKRSRASATRGSQNRRPPDAAATRRPRPEAGGARREAGEEPERVGAEDEARAAGPRRRAHDARGRDPNGPADPRTGDCGHPPPRDRG